MSTLQTSRLDPGYTPFLNQFGTPEADDAGRTQATDRTSRVFLLLKDSAFWVFGGAGFMIAGIAIVQATILPRIYACPQGALCQHSFNPRGKVLQLVQTLMQYWLQIGTVITAVGSIRLVAYQSWLIMMMQSNTVENLDLNLGVIKGSPYDTVRLFLKKGYRSLSLFALAHLVIAALISLVVGFSIVGSPGQLLITFQYADTLTFPDSSVGQLNSDSQRTAIDKLQNWALTNDTSHGLLEGFSGTLVSPDTRLASAIHPWPSGPQIYGNISCSGVTNYSFIEENSSGVRYYRISHRGLDYTAMSNFLLATTMTFTGTARTQYLWTSNVTGTLPNATVTDDGRLHLTICNHTISMLNVPPRGGDEGTQYIEHSLPVTDGCSGDRNVCAADSVNSAILEWWGGIGTNFWRVTCRGGVVGPLYFASETCVLRNELWTSTVRGMLDAIVQTAPQSGNATQQLWTRVETRNVRWWWLQGIIPFAIIILYVATLAYTVHLCQGSESLKQIDLAEVIAAAQVGDKLHMHSFSNSEAGLGTPDSMMLSGLPASLAQPN